MLPQFFCLYSIFILDVLLDIFEKVKLNIKCDPFYRKTFLIPPCFFTLMYVSRIENSSPLEVKITFVMVNDSSNSDVKKSMVWNIEVFSNTTGGLCFLFYCLQCFQPLNTSFLFHETGSDNNSLVFSQVWIMQTELPLSREPSESAKVLLTTCRICCDIINFVPKKSFWLC